MKRVLAGLAFGLAAAVVTADGTPISGKVLDAGGKPAALVEVGAEWNNKGGAQVAAQVWRTDAEGKFVGQIHWLKHPMALVAMDAARKSGAVRLVEESDLGKPLEFRLGPVVAVKGNLVCPALGASLGGTSVLVNLTPKPWRVLQMVSKDSRFAFVLPAGEYELQCLAYETRLLTLKLVLPADKAEIDLGDVEMQPTVIAEHWGKEPPAWKATEARGCEPGATLADFRGKWVLVVFWHSASDNCTRSLLPRLRELCETHAAKRESFEILAIHAPGTGTMKELDDAMAKIVAGPWGGKPLPFPMLIDASGETWKTYGIRNLPALMLVDPEGKVVERATEKTLEDKLK